MVHTSAPFTDAEGRYRGRRCACGFVASIGVPGHDWDAMVRHQNEVRKRRAANPPSAIRKPQ